MTGYDLAELAVASGSAGGVFGVVMVAVRWAANFIAGRYDKRAEQVDAGMTKLVADLNARIDMISESERNLRDELTKDREEFRAYQRETDRQLSECRRKHAESEAEVLQLKALIAARGEIRQRAQLIVSDEKRKARDA